MHRFSHLLPLLLLVFACASARAEQADVSDTSGAYEIHYIAVNSTFLQPEIAAQYGIVRNPRNAFLNVAILRKNPAGGTTPVTAVLSGSKNNLLQQSEALSFTEVREGEAIYYIGQFTFSDAEILRFEITAQPQGGATHAIEWSTQLYAQ